MDRASSWMLALVLLSACGGGATIPGTDGRRVQPPEDLGCTDDSRWALQLIDPGTSGIDSRLFVDRSGRVSIIEEGPSDGANVAFYQKEASEDRFTRIDTPREIAPGITAGEAVVIAQNGDIQLLVTTEEEPSMYAYRVVTWDGSQWSLGDPIPEGPGTEYADYVQNQIGCTMAANGPHRLHDHFLMRNPSDPLDFPYRMFDFSDGVVKDLGLVRHGFQGCASFEDRVVARFAFPGPRGAFGAAGVSVQELVDGESAWTEVGRYGTTVDGYATSLDTFYESSQGLRVIQAGGRPSDRWEGHGDAMLYDMALDGLDQHGPIDLVRYVPYVALEESYASIDQVHVARDEGGFTHVVYRRAGCDHCEDSPGLAGGFGLRYAVRTDAGWVRQDVLWQNMEPTAYDEGQLGIVDMVAWNGEVHVLVYLGPSMGGASSRAFFTLGAHGSSEQEYPAGLYDVYARGCAAR